MGTDTVILCSVAPCGRPAALSRYGNPGQLGMCKAHYHRQNVYGSPWAGGTFRNIRGGKYATYDQAHRRLLAARGKAADNDCVDCGGPAAEWSYNNSGISEVTGMRRRKPATYSLDMDQYDPRCVTCHRLFDDNPVAMRRVHGPA